MRTSLLIFAILMALTGCNKFNHSEIEVPSCELCDDALLWEGSFRGEVNNAYILSDSATVNVQQVFLGNSAWEDSTIMFFDVDVKFDSMPQFNFVQTFRIRDASGQNPDFRLGSNHWIEWISQDSIRINRTIYTQFGDILQLVDGTIPKQ